MNLTTLLLGKPLPTSQERAEQIGPSAGIPIFGLDALSSAGYGPEAALTLLIPLGAAGLDHIVPLTAAIIALLAVVFISYLQTIEAYPGGGGSYTVARENLGESTALLAASALMIDYVLTAAVGISAGVGALVSAVPSLQPHTLGLCLGILAAIAYVNLRGVRDAGLFFMIPTYLFIGTLGGALLWGLFKAVAAGGHPVPVTPPPLPPAPVAAVGAWLLIQAFASGCTAMTGVEAVSNGVKAFREPAVRNAKITLTIIIAILILMLGGIAWLARAYGIVAVDPNGPGYQSVLSMLIGAIAGKGAFYYVSMVSILLVLSLSANTAFADFPRLCQAIALDGYLPPTFASRGRRLVFSQGLFALSALAGVLLVIFGGITDRLIPLYAVGAFLAFTLSQAGMVAHWRKIGGARGWRGVLINGAGALVTGATVLVVLAAKFMEGAWAVAILIPALFAAMKAVHRHYARIRRETETSAPLDLSRLSAPLVIVPLIGLNKAGLKALRFAYALSREVEAVHVTPEKGSGEELLGRWARDVEAPAIAAGLPPAKLRMLESPYRFILGPIVAHVLKTAKANPERQVAVVIPEVVEDRWYNHLLHAQNAAMLKALLYFQGTGSVVVVNVPWYVGKPKSGPRA
jgi:amino acid transporter